MSSLRGKREAGHRSWMFKPVEKTCSNVVVVGCFILVHIYYYVSPLMKYQFINDPICTVRTEMLFTLLKV
jgi:hypothetical protein